VETSGRSRYGAGEWRRICLLGMSSCRSSCSECQSKDRSPTFHPPLSLHDLLTKRVEITLDWRKFIKSSFMTCNTSRQKNFAVIVSRIMRWGRRGACSTYGEKLNTYKVLVGKTEGKSLRRPKRNG